MKVVWELGMPFPIFLVALVAWLIIDGGWGVVALNLRGCYSTETMTPKCDRLRCSGPAFESQTVMLLGEQACFGIPQVFIFVRQQIICFAGASRMISSIGRYSELRKTVKGAVRIRLDSRRGQIIQRSYFDRALQPKMSYLKSLRYIDLSHIYFRSKQLSNVLQSSDPARFVYQASSLCVRDNETRFPKQLSPSAIPVPGRLIIVYRAEIISTLS